MGPNKLEADEAIDLLGLEEAGTNKPAEPDVLDVEFPPIVPAKPGIVHTSAAAGASAVVGQPIVGQPVVGQPVMGTPVGREAAPAAPSDEARRQLATAQQAQKKAEEQLAAVQKQARAAAEEHKKLAERVKQLESELGAARKSGGEALQKENAELRAQVEALRKTGGRPGLPSDGTEGPPPPEGALEQLPYARLVTALMKSRFTGRLHLKTGNAKREVYFEDGAPGAFSSSEPGERLGRVLVAQGIITEQQYLAAAQAMVERGAKLTEALLEMGAITNERLQQEQRQLTRDQIVSGFGLTQGTFTLEPGKTPPDEVTKFEFSLGEIFVQGYRKYAPEADTKNVYDQLRDSYVRARDEMAAFRGQLALDQDDERILKMLGEAYTLGEALERSGVAHDKGVRLIGALRMLGFITDWKPGVAEFEARLKTEKIRQTEEMLALKQTLDKREDELFKVIQESLKRIESQLQHGVKTVGGAESPPPPPPRPGTNPALGSMSPSLSSPAPSTGEVRRTGTNLGSQLASAGAAAPAPTTNTNLGAALDDKGEDGPGHDRYKEGMRQAAAGRLDEAETALRESVRLDATKPAYLTALARVLLANPRYERAGTLPVVRSLLDRAQALAPGDAEVTALLQRIQQEMT